MSIFDWAVEQCIVYHLFLSNKTWNLFFILQHNLVNIKKIYRSLMEEKNGFHFHSEQPSQADQCLGSPFEEGRNTLWIGML